MHGRERKRFDQDDDGDGKKIAASCAVPGVLAPHFAGEMATALAK